MVVIGPGRGRSPNPTLQGACAPRLQQQASQPCTPKLVLKSEQQLCLQNPASPAQRQVHILPLFIWLAYFRPRRAVCLPEHASSVQGPRTGCGV